MNDIMTKLQTTGDGVGARLQVAGRQGVKLTSQPQGQPDATRIYTANFIQYFIDHLKNIKNVS